MPCHMPTDHHGRVAWLGVVKDRAVTLTAAPRTALTLTHDGAEGDCHAGRTRASCSRVKLQYDRGTEIANARQVSVLSVEELAEIAAAMKIDRIAPEWTGANIVFEGLPALTLLPPASRLIFESGASVVVDVENGPCKFVAEEIERRHPGKGLSFPAKAAGRRGFVGWVERPGEIALGMIARLHLPAQKPWPGA